MAMDDIRRLSKTAYDFLSNTDLKNLPLGRYYFENSIYANVEEYETKSRHQYESHRKYIDIQYIITGEENMLVDTLDHLTLKTPYDALLDRTFYFSNECRNEYMIFYPEDGHMPCLINGEPFYVKKIVFKIPFSVTKDIKYLVMDVDGTLTDGKIYMGNDGEIFKAFNIKDGQGMSILKRHGIEPIIITGRESRIVENRCKELKIEHLYQGVKDKKEKLAELVKKLDVELCNIAYIGDDENDLDCINLVNDSKGLSACPFDAIDMVKDKVSFVCTKNSGDGAVREFIEWIAYGKEKL